MKRIEQKILYSTEANSDKVYEADICEVSDGKYLVNFRFGRRGSNLKEGTKTTSPVSLNEAYKLFNELVQSKTKKGYQEVSEIPTTEIKPVQKTKVPEVEDNNPQKVAILKRLAQRKGNWKLSRAIWRAGELEIKEATPLLLNLLDSGDDLQKYCVIWSLGFCGDESIMESLGKIYQDKKSSDMVRRISCEALLKLSDTETKKYFSNDMAEKLPNDLKIPAQKGPASLFNEIFKNYLKDNNKSRFEVIDTLYLIDNEYTRPALLEYLQNAPLKPSHFKRLRHIFKASEYRRDAEVYGILAYRFEKEKAMFNSHGYGYKSDWGYVVVDGNYLRSKDVRKNIKTPDSTVSYSSKTRDYFKKRVCRTLKTLGEDNNEDYVKMAVGVLLQYNDNDISPITRTVRSLYSFTTRQYTTTEKYWHAYANYLAFSFILYGNSERITKLENSKAWSYISPHAPSDLPTSKREEAFPELWNKNYHGLLELLAKSQCHEIHIFAIKALKELKDIWDNIDIKTLTLLLKSKYNETSEFALERIKEKYNPDFPDSELINIMLNCNFANARKQAFAWILNKSDYFFNPDFIYQLINSDYSDTRLFIFDLIRNGLTEEQNKSIIARSISVLMNISDINKAEDITHILFRLFHNSLKNISLNIADDLLNSPMVEIQEFAAKIVFNHELSPYSIPQNILDKIIKSPFMDVREYGIKIINQLSDDSLLTKADLIVSFITHTEDDLRELVKPLIKRLSDYNNDFAKNIINKLLQLLAHKEEYPGLHADINNLLNEYLTDKLNIIDKDKAWELVNSKYPQAQDLGGNLFFRNENLSWANDMSIIDIVKMSNHEILSVRKASWKMLSYLNKKIINNSNKLLQVMRFFDSKKEDSREVARNQFSSFFDDTDWNPELLIGLSDSIYPDVRKFGRDLIMKYFKSEEGTEYLTKLSEHPSTDIQFFATGYLEEYAADKPEKLEELKPYFKRILAQVNRSRVAKDRILIFLTKEADKNQDSAKIVAEILTWYSATIAISDKAKAIETLLKINHKYSWITSPLRIKEVEVRHGV